MGMDAKDLPFTGERYIPGCGGPQMLYEHVHRYLLSGLLARERRVLDLASGEGYGSFYLAETAAWVTGLDLDPGVLAHAAAAYARPNLSFVCGRADRLPFASRTFDLVAAFEIIEHVEAQAAMLAEIARVMRPSGVALVSTPNKKVYSDARQYVNPFHVREFYIPEFEALLRQYFPHVLLLGQRLTTGSLIWSPSASAGGRSLGPEGVLHTIAAAVPDRPAAPSDWAEEAMYVIALCSESPLTLPATFCPAGLLDRQGAYLAELRSQIHWSQGLADELAAKDARILALQREVETLSQWGRRSDAEIQEKDRLILKLQAEVQALSSWGDRLAVESDGKDATILRMQKEFAERTEWALQLDARCRALTAQLEEIQRTFAYRACRKIGALP